MFGYHNKLVWVNLTEGLIVERPIDEWDIDLFIGGAGLGASILAKITDAETDPLGPENPLIYMTGPFTATKAPAGSRFELISLSPLTGIYGESNSGGSFGWNLKRTGIDGLVITGASPSPVVLNIEADGTVSLEPAEELWSLDVFSADAKLKEAKGEKIVTGLIGPAGENLVRFASVSHDGKHTRSAGRCGLGAVMGSKHLKGLVVSTAGRAKVDLADEESFGASVKEAIVRINEKLAAFGEMGTPGGVINYDKLGNLPINNWREARAPEVAEKTTGGVMKETLQVKRSGCSGCPIRCGRLVEVKEGAYSTEGVVEAPEYETLAAFGVLQLNDNLEAIAKANETCNKLGLDTISAGMTIAFANECFEKGVVTTADTDGKELKFGDPDGIIDLLERIAFAKDDFAKILGLGSRAAADIFGGSAAEYAVHCKGLEFPMHDPRFSWGHAVSYPTGPRGACHLSSLSHPFELGTGIPEMGYDGPFPGRQREGKAEWVTHLQNFMTICDSLINCKFNLFFSSVTLTDLAQWVNAITGSNHDPDSIMEAGARAFNLKRMINNRRGIGRKDDVMPPRMRTLKKKGQDVDYDIPPYDQLLSDYYEIRGWNEEGRPLDEVIDKLGLREYAEMMSD